MTGKRKELGAAGERLAARYLEKQGYRILDANYRARRGEIDIVAEDGGVIVFVEVKTRTDERFGTPQEAVTATKRVHLAKAAASYLARHGWQERPCRFDVVSVMNTPDRSEPQIELIRNAFSLDT